MSLNGAFWISTAAMGAQSQALGAIGDNIANLNTGGYRRRESNFFEMLGRTDKHLAKSAGTKVDVKTKVEEAGSYAPSSRGLNAAMNGRALFVVSKNGAGTDQYFTRVGAFEPLRDPAGVQRLATPEGYYLMGWPVAPDGTVTQSLQTIALPDKSTPLPAVASTTAAISDNLPASATLGEQVDRSLSVYDTNGTLHNVTLSFVNTGTNAWNVTASSPTGTIALSTSPMPLNFSSADGTVSGAASVAIAGSWNTGASAAISLDLAAMTQWGEESAPRAAVVNGSAAGIASSFYFDSNGFLNVNYSNGLTRPVYQIPGAVFRNADGLTEHSGDVFKANEASGKPMLIDPNTSQLGSFLANTLELSNVDLASEMTDLIQTQRAYSTAATAFRTVDEMMATIRDMKR
ncbi:MAG: flagellar hook protein FlgE [Alphaproteobacteria bacterium]